MFQLMILSVFFLVLSRTTAKDEVIQFPPLIKAQEGDTINITCLASGKLHGLYLRRLTVMRMKVIYLSENEFITAMNYKNRTSISGPLSNLMVTITNVQLNDTDVYICEGIMIRENLQGNGTIVVVTEKKWKQEVGGENGNKNLQVYPYTYPIMMVLFFAFGLALGPLYMKMKKLRKKFNLRRTQNPLNSVYEDMSYTIHRNTMCQDNEYN
ncbi:T-cell antigen CD7 [Gracilinanus agilis]|uniref:T-cell antigen CD7 n=1 Tax=Gracilinanus agilis TaxID=191870 RepID=UPI001CFE7339|nr:T-cell antigen CD7 [Gracilinanus agilis]